MASQMSQVEGVQKYKLANGMEVLLEEDHSAPVVAINVWVKTGSVCEQKGEHGIAHVHEHMLFKGTKKRAVGEIARVIEAGGGEINAYTSFDETVYYVVSASRFLGTGLDVLSDAMQNSTFDPNELQKELQVILEELKRGEDSPSRVLQEKLFSTAYSKLPYKRPVIGTAESINSFTREKVVNFYHKWYSPDNMVLVVVGDFKKDDIVPRIEKTFGKLEEREIPDCSVPKEPKQEDIKTYSIEKQLNEAYFSMAYHIPAAGNEDVPALDVLSGILGQGESSRLFRDVKEDKGYVNNIYAYSFTPKHEGLFLVGGTFDPDQAKNAYPEILEQIYKLKNIPVGTDELAKAKLNIESDFIHAKETMQGQAQKLGTFEVDMGDYRYEDKYLQDVRNVTADDIMRVAKKYFTSSNLTAGVLYPTGKVTLDGDSLKSLLLKNTDELEKKYNKKSNANNKEVIKKVLPNGITVLIKQTDSVPLFAARAVFLGGSRYENNSDNGISNFVSEMFVRGTNRRTSGQIASQVESMGGEIDGYSGKNSIGVTVESLSRNFNESMDIFADVIRNASFPKEEVERARREILSDINRQKDNLVRKTVNLFLDNLFKHHPYRYDVLGDESTIKEMGRKDLVDFYNRVIQPENMVISVVGSLDPDIVMDNIKKNFGDMKKGDFKAVQINPESEQNKIRKAVAPEENKAQTHIILGYLAPTMKSRDEYAFEVLNSVLSGQGGRLFLELRDKMSLAYTITSFYTPGLENGYFGVYIGTSPDKEEEAIEAIKKQLSLLLEKGITKEELERAQNHIVGTFEIGLQRNSSQAAKIGFDERYGLGWDEYKKYPEEIYSVTTEDVLRVAEKYIHPDKYTLAIVKNKQD